MSSVLQTRLNELRFIDGIEKVEHVPYPTGDQFWVRFNRPLDFKKLNEIAKRRGYEMMKFGGLPSKLPGRLVEVLWDGVNHVIVKNPNGLTKLTASLGIEPEGVAKIATDLHGPYQIFMAMNEEGVQLLYDYLGLKYVPPPPPPPKPVVPAKPVIPAIPAAKPPVPVPTTVPRPLPPATTPSVPNPAASPSTPPPPTVPSTTPQSNTSTQTVQSAIPESPNPSVTQPQTEKKSPTPS
ncbi:MAG TPA: hypothetical protein VJZ32_01895 [Candidatus Bathyarchaeia archaeon]|nr:hypothetical protein [Candidatus Bathyarchaeia archaeon]